MTFEEAMKKVLEMEALHADFHSDYVYHRQMPHAILALAIAIKESAALPAFPRDGIDSLQSSPQQIR